MSAHRPAHVAIHAANGVGDRFPERTVVHHYKDPGKHYVVAGHGRDTETGAEVVAYRSLQDGALWVRPAAMFGDSVMLPSGPTPRFTVVTEAPPADPDASATPD